MELTDEYRDLKTENDHTGKGNGQAKKSVNRNT